METNPWNRQYEEYLDDLQMMPPTHAVLWFAQAAVTYFLDELEESDL